MRQKFNFDIELKELKQRIKICLNNSTDYNLSEQLQLAWANKWLSTMKILEKQ